VFDEPRECIKAIPGIELVEMKNVKMDSRCCGAGGGFKSANNDFAINIAAERVKQAKDTGAEILVTACPFCVLNLTQGAKKAKIDIKVMDISELLMQATDPVVEAPKAEAPAEKKA
jgi:Fe-S oxidoreductase